ncbi:hydroxyacid dehydrogenase [Salinarimonas sp.]|uniref:hydroxyacid dehydrogenase n=1 Tax=Salinarimonas sp. TaxID=2766526 RepID=UPI0032D8C45B
MARIAIFEVEEWERETFADLARAHDVVFREETLEAGNAGEAAGAEVLSTFIYSRLTREVLEPFENLKLIATRSTGFDHVDLDTCEERGIQVANVPSYGENTVAEHVFALLGAISHNIVAAADRTRRGDFSHEGLQGFDLKGRTLGVVGTGHIGRWAARIARGYGMEVLAFDVKPDEEAAREIGFAYVAMDELLARSDVVTLHVPGSEKTKHLISRDEFAKMKDGSVLINTARGPVVDVDALLHALASGKLRAAGLDVLPQEPVVREEAELLRTYFRKEHKLDTLLADHILLRLSNVVITPHTAFDTKEAVQRILDTTHDNIAGFLEGEPRNVVNG